MKQQIKISLLLLLVFLCFSAISMSAEEGYGKTKWGMNEEELKKLYPFKTFKKLEKNIISFEDEIAKEKVEIFFSFLESKPIITKNDKEEKNKVSFIGDKLYEVRIIPRSSPISSGKRFLL